MTDSLFFSSLLVTHLIQFSIVIAVAAVLVAFTGRRWPHLAFLICMMALLKSLTPPVVSSPTSVFSMNHTLALSSELHMASLYDKIRQGTPVTRTGTAGALTPVDSPVLSDPGMSRVVSRWASGIPWARVLLVIWVTGAAVVLGRAIWVLLRFRYLSHRRRGRVPRHIRGMISEIAEALRFRRPIDVLISDANEGPAIIGFLHPMLILPRALVSHSTERQLRPIIAHELIHARRGDALWGTLQFCAQVVWWFHPFVWWLGRRASLLCERCCDEEAIAGLKCSAADYAESLVRVLALRNVFRPVPCGNSMRASEVTGQRLERLMKRCGRFYSRTPASSWLLMLGLALLLLPGAAWSTADEPESPQDPMSLRQQINLALQEERWADAATHLQQAVEFDDTDARAVFMLGYTLHMQGRYDEAITWHRRAAEFEQVRPTALYNVACVEALTGRQVEALETLEQAIDAGFRHQSDIADDPDFESLRDSERFQALRTRARRDSGNDVRRAFDFWVGTWDVVDEDGEKLGSNVIAREENGFLLTEQWRSRGGGSGSSVNFYDPADGMWHQVWVDSRGSVIRAKGNMQDGAMVMHGSSVDANGSSKRVRLTFRPESDDRVLQHFEESEDDGETWTTVFRGYYQQRKQQSPPDSVETTIESCASVIFDADACDRECDGTHCAGPTANQPAPSPAIRYNQRGLYDRI